MHRQLKASTCSLHKNTPKEKRVYKCLNRQACYFSPADDISPGSAVECRSSEKRLIRRSGAMSCECCVAIVGGAGIFYLVAPSSRCDNDLSGLWRGLCWQNIAHHAGVLLYHAKTNACLFEYDIEVRQAPRKMSTRSLIKKMLPERQKGRACPGIAWTRDLCVLGREESCEKPAYSEALQYQALVTLLLGCRGLQCGNNGL